MGILTPQALPERIAALEKTTFVGENKVHSIALYQFVNNEIIKRLYVDLI